MGMMDLEGVLAVGALEAGPVKDDPVGVELIHEVHRLLARLALLRRPAERHPHSLPFSNPLS